MNRRKNEPSFSSLAAAHVVAALAGGAAICVSAGAGGLWHWSGAPAPFVWRDVAIVYLLCLVPLAASLYVAVTAWSSQIIPVLLVEIVAVLIVPRLYVHARCRNDVERIGGLIEQSRLGEARELLSRVLELKPSATWQGVELRTAAGQLDRAVQEIESRTDRPLDNDASDDDRVSRARDLAMLGHAGKALSVPGVSPSAADSPEGCNLRGTIHETMSQWLSARDWYSRAEAGWQARDDSTDRTAGLVKALAGIAYSERKLGHLHEAQAAYEKLLALSPTADSHFLVAQFYEDMQQAKLAQFHARQAIALNPERYERRGQQLIDKLVTSHFGCLTAFAARDRITSSTGISSPANPGLITK